MDESFLCRKADRHGRFNRRCMQTVKPRKEPTRQCLLAAEKDRLFCHMHRAEPIQPEPPRLISSWALLHTIVQRIFPRNPK